MEQLCMTLDIFKIADNLNYVFAYSLLDETLYICDIIADILEQCQKYALFESNQ